MNVIERPSLNGHVTTTRIDLPNRRRAFPWKIVGVVILIAAIVVTAVIVVSRRAGAVTYTTVPVAQRTLVSTVTATGTVSPQDYINVGSQESGTISQLYVDYNSRVHKGQVLARIDPTSFQQAVDQAQAAVAQAQANAQASAATAQGSAAGISVAQANAQAAQAQAKAAQMTAQSNQQAIASAQANIEKAQSALSLAQQTVNRDQSLLSQGYVAQNQVDTDRSNLVAAQTALQSAQVAAQQARAQAAAGTSQAVASAAQSAASSDQSLVAGESAQTTAAQHQAGVAAIGIAQAQLAQAQENLNRTIITSPVDGTVIARSVSLGQTVAASLQTPTLFTIAPDLRNMEVDVAVGEPDIGQVKKGEAVDFTVLAYPNRVFQGTVTQVRQNPTTVNNVVTYTTVVSTNNSDGSLRPGMTANASIHVAKATNATVVPLAALQYQPPTGSLAHRAHRTRGTAGANAARGSGGGSAAGGASPWGQTSSTGSSVVTPGSRGRVFVQTPTGLRPVPVQIGLVSGTDVSVTPLRGSLDAGTPIVIGDSTATVSRSRSNTASNPFAPQQAPRGGGFGGRGPGG